MENTWTSGKLPCQRQAAGLGMKSQLTGQGRVSWTTCTGIGNIEDFPASAATQQKDRVHKNEVESHVRPGYDGHDPLYPVLESRPASDTGSEMDRRRLESSGSGG